MIGFFTNASASNRACFAENAFVTDCPVKPSLSMTLRPRRPVAVIMHEIPFGFLGETSVKITPSETIFIASK